MRPLKTLGTLSLAALVVACAGGSRRASVASDPWIEPRGGADLTATSPAASAPPRASPEGPGAATPAEDRAMFEAANRERVTRGLRPFRWNDALHRAAVDHSAEQARHGYMGHGSPDPSRDDLADRLRLAGLRELGRWAEVVAKGYQGPESVTLGWMNSRGHRKILLDPALEEAGFSRVGDCFTGNFATPLRR